MRNKEFGGVNVFISGMIVGALGIILTHEPTRKRLKKALTNMMEEGDRKIEELGENTTVAKKRASKRIGKLRSLARKKVAGELKKAQQKLEERS
jgi:hypothetical protein